MIEYNGLLFRNASSECDIFRRTAAINYRIAFSCDIWRIYNVVMVCMGDKNSPKTVDMMKIDKFVTQSGIGFLTCTSDVFNK